MASRAFLAAFGWLIGVVRSLAGDVLESANFVTQLPPGLTYRHEWVEHGVRTSTALALLLLGAFLALQLLSAVLRVLWDRGFGDVLATLPAYVVVLALLRWYPALVEWGITVANALAARFLDPSTGLPGWEQMGGFDQSTNLGVFALVYWFGSGLLVFGRAVTVLAVRLLIVAGPLLIVLGASPFAWGRHWFGWWLGLLLARVSAQVFQAFALGAGASLLASGQTPADLLWGIGAVWLAVIFPSMLPGAGGTGLGLFARAAGVAATAAGGVPWGAAAGGLSGGGRTGQPAPPTPSGPPDWSRRRVPTTARPGRRTA